MKTLITNKNGSLLMCIQDLNTIKALVLSSLMFFCFQFSLQAQGEKFSKPTWWFGAAGGANFNFYRGSTQELNSDITSPATFHNGNGIGLFLAPLIEFHRPASEWGIMLQAGFDSRKGSFDEITTPCNCPADLLTDLSYITIEPSLRLAPFKSNFYLYAGPRIAFLYSKSFTYQLNNNPEFTDQLPNPEIKGDLNHMNNTLISMQIGAGYDIPISSQTRRTQYIISPFVSFQPYFGQSPRTIETWNLTTLRFGAALKLGRGHKIPNSEIETIQILAQDNKRVINYPDVKFSVNSPKNIPIERRVRETFPLRNYVYFNEGSINIPERYVLLKKNQVKDFKEDQLEVFSPKKLSGRSDREMVVYYNILNILGDRMGKNPTTTINLVGSSEKGPEDGTVMAEAVKEYLVNIFSIDPQRISIEGRDKPKIPSEKPGGVRELDLLREGDRRVSIESSSPPLLMEFQSGPDAPLKPVEIIALKEAPIDSYLTFNVEGAGESFSTWKLIIMDEKGNQQYFGPYTLDKISIPGKAILGTRPEGDYNVKMIGQTKNGMSVVKETSVHMVLWTPPQNEEMMRFSILYEFNESKAITLYEKYLTDIVTPKIPLNGKVIIHGYTDIIGDETHNHMLSVARANDVKNIIESSLASAGRKDVLIEVYGFGENESLSPFDNTFPEERSYNRTVIIDILPVQ